MSHASVARAFAALWLVVPAVGCSLSVDQILEIRDGSHLDLAFAGIPSNPLPDAEADVLPLTGGTVMRLDVSLSLLDYLDGVADGDIEVLDLLIAVPAFHLFGSETYYTGDICIVLDETRENGGAFTYDLIDETATFDLVLETLGLVGNPAFAAFLPGGAIRFPFAFQSSSEMTAVDAVGLFSGTGRLEVEEEVDEYVVFPLSFGTSQLDLLFHVTGTIGLRSTDAFPTPPLVLSCLEFLESRGG